MLYTSDGHPATIVQDFGNVLGNSLEVKRQELNSRLGLNLKPEESNHLHFEDYLPELLPEYYVIRNQVNGDTHFLTQTEAMKDAPTTVNELSDYFMFHTVTSRGDQYRIALPTWLHFKEFKAGCILDCTESKPKGPTIIKIPGTIAILESDAYKLWEIAATYSQHNMPVPDLYLFQHPGERELPPPGTTVYSGWKHNGKLVTKNILERARERFDLRENLESRAA